MKLEKMTDDQIGNAVKTAVREAIDFIESEIADERSLAMRYFDGESRLKYEDGRSKVVATKCRDTVRAIKPALMRVFLQSGTPVEFMPRRPETVQAATQATKYAKYIFERNNGFDILSSVFHDALIKKVGIAKVYYDEAPEVEFDNYTGLTPEQVAYVTQQEGVEVIEETQPEFGLVDMRVSMQRSNGGIKIDAIAPEDFFVDRGARSIRDCYICGNSTEGRVGDLVALGFDFDEVYDLAGTGSDGDEEEFARTGWDDTDQDETIDDPSMRKILITDAYMRMDVEGTGVPKLYKFLCAGDKYKVLDYEPADQIPYAVFEVDPEPHTFFGRSLVDIIIDDQDAATALMRGLLDNISLMNNPSLIVNDRMVEMDDVLNNEIGRIIRTEDVNALREMVTGSAAAAALPAMQFYDEAIRAKTGVTGAAMGMDADALQGQTATGVNAAVQAATAVSELIARTLAEGGMRQLFDIIAKLARQNPDPEEMIRIDGQFEPVDPTSWGTGLDIVTNVGLGNNRHDERAMTLQQALQLQMQVYGTYGKTNGLVSLTNIRNTMADIMDIGGVHNADRYMQPMTPEIEAQLLEAMAQQEAAAAQQGGSDPNAAFLQAEQMKAQTRAQVDMQKAMMEHQRALIQMSSADDLERDKMVQSLLVDAAKVLGQYGATVDVARVRSAQEAPRQFGPQGGVVNG